MSTRFFLEEEHVATLEEALAFIDEFAQDDDGDGAVSGSEESDAASDTSSFSPSHTSTTAATSTNGMKAAVGGSGDSTDENAADRDALAARPGRRVAQSKRIANTTTVGRYRRRNKDEILELRGKVAEMEARIDYLKKRKDAWVVARKLQNAHEPDLALLASNPVLLEMFATLIGIDKVGLERRRLEQALLVNQRLRTALMRLLPMDTTLDSVFSKQISKEDLYFLFGIEPQFNVLPSAPLPASDSLVFAGLHHSLETQYLTSLTVPDVLTAACARMDQVFTASRVLEHPLVGQIREVNSSTPLVLSLQKLVEMREGLNRGSGGEFTRRSKPFTQIRTGPYEDSMEKQYTMAFRSSQCGDVHINAVSVARKYVQQNRVLYMYTSRLAVVGTALVFREFGCMILADASSGSSGTTNNTSKSSSSNPPLTASSVYQVSYQIFTETRDPHMPPGISAYLEDFIASSQSNQMHAHRLEVQNILVHEFGCHPPPVADMRGYGTKLLIECPAR
ncbi:hypothetical protein FI667_g11722, partial [Globisporangium splendens]